MKSSRVTVPAPKGQTKPAARTATGVLAGFFALTAILAGGAGLGIGLLAGKSGGHDAAASATTTTSAVELPAGAALGPCDGLAGALVTSGAGKRDSAVGVVAAFEYAYYVDRNPQAALEMTTPAARLDLAALTASIGALPAGTQHCVAITQSSPNEVSVVLVVATPGKRSMHRQMLSVTPAAPFLITGFREN